MPSTDSFPCEAKVGAVTCSPGCWPPIWLPIPTEFKTAPITRLRSGTRPPP
nr:hypothetical protein Iba_chr03aCG0410 [Ipomoea batatas]